MSFGEYYAGKMGTLSHSIEDAHDAVISRSAHKVTTAECKRLEVLFNAIFYPKEMSTTAIKNINFIRKTIDAAYYKKYEAVLNNFDIGSSEVTYGAQVSDLPQLIRDKYESFNHKEKIYSETIKSRLEKVKAVLAQVKNVDDLDNTKKQLLVLERDLNNLLNIKTDNDARGSFISLKDNEDIIKQVQSMDEQYQALSQLGGVFSPNDYGQVLEWILQAFSGQTDNIINEYADKLIDEDFVNSIMKTAGSQKTGGNGLIKMKIKSITTDGKFVKKGKTSSGTSSYEISNGRSKFSFKAIQGFNPNSDRQGKMDVNFEYNDGVNLIPFRISAKNWMNLNRDLGETNIAYALLRSLEQDDALLYLYTMQDERKENRDEIAIAHKLAKYAILIDILMGFSQTENYADTLFLNIREEKRVAVYSISDIIEKINRNLDTFNVMGYSSTDIYRKMVNIRKALGKTNRSDDFEALSLKYLQATQVRLQYSNIASFLK